MTAKLAPEVKLARAQARIQARAQGRADVLALERAAVPFVSRPPAELSSWGVVRVRAWSLLRERYVRTAGRERASTKTIVAARDKLTEVSQLPLERCSEIVCKVKAPKQVLAVAAG